MTADTWIAIGTALLVVAAAIGGLWRTAFSLGEIRIGVKELLTRDERMDARVGTLEGRVNDHMERISRVEGELSIRRERK